MNEDAISTRSLRNRNRINFPIAFYKQICEVFPVIVTKVKPLGLIQLFCLGFLVKIYGNVRISVFIKK